MRYHTGESFVSGEALCAHLCLFRVSASEGVGSSRTTCNPGFEVTSAPLTLSWPLGANSTLATSGRQVETNVAVFYSIPVLGVFLGFGSRHLAPSVT